MQKTFTSLLKTPLGYMAPLCDKEGVYALIWQQTPLTFAENENDVSRETKDQLQSYLLGKLKRFTVPISTKAATPALYRWMMVMSQIPYGETASYKELATLWGNQKASRAAGGACQKNPIPIIVPCHRIIGSDGRFDKYSGGDISTPSDKANIARKKALLDLEAGLSTIL